MAVAVSYTHLDVYKRQVTERALSGLFTTIGGEEKKIRLDPIGTGSDIITRVFGSIKK